MTLRDELHAHLSRFVTAPFLFVGSGMSRRYIDSETWEGLLSRFAEQMGRPYAPYSSAANGDYAAIASALGEDFFNHWWDDPRYEVSRIEYPRPARRSSPLKIEIASHVEDLIKNLPTSGPTADEIELLKKAVLQGIITTNYDPLLETLFPQLEVFTGQEELMFSDPVGVGEIYKIHGSYKKPESLILTSEDYEGFEKKNPYLAAKLLTIFVEHPVLFLGYSLSDPNIRQILTNIASILTQDNISKLQDRLIFIQWAPNISAPPRMSQTVFPVDALSLPIHQITVSSYEEIFDALSSLKQRIPVPFLRRWQKQITELVRTSDPKEKTFVRDIDDAVNVSDLEVVVGVGLHRRLELQEEGLVGQDRYHLLRDIITPRLPENHVPSMKKVVSSVLPRYLTARTNTPIYKYLRAAGYLNPDGTLNSDDVPERVKYRVAVGLSFYESQYQREREQLKLTAAGVQDFGVFLRNSSWWEFSRVLPYLDRQIIDLDALRESLKRALESSEHLVETYIAKAICMYDLLLHQKEQP
jgi:hypothetical protein